MLVPFHCVGRVCEGQKEPENNQKSCTEPIGDRLVQVAAGLLVAYGIGAIAGPIVAAQIMGRIGPQGLFLFIAAVAFSVGLFTVLRIAIRPRGVARKAPFLPLGSIGISRKQLYVAALKSRLRKKPN